MRRMITKHFYHMTLYIVNTMNDFVPLIYDCPLPAKNHSCAPAPCAWGSLGTEDNFDECPPPRPIHSLPRVQVSQRFPHTDKVLGYF